MSENERKADTSGPKFSENQPPYKIQLQEAVAALQMIDATAAKAGVSRAEHRRSEAAAALLMEYINPPAPMPAVRLTQATGKQGAPVDK